MSVQDEAEALARELCEAKSKLRAAGRTLHDQVGPLLSAAGIGLELLRSDFPQLTDSAAPVLTALGEAMERVRAVSRELNPPPGAHLGLRRALESLVETAQDSFSGAIDFTYSASAAGLPDETAAAIYEAASAALNFAVADRIATRISISARGRRAVTVTIDTDGRARWTRAALASQSRRARPAGVVLELGTKKGTIVAIRYAPRRPTRG